MDGVSAKAKRRWLLRWWTVQALVVYFGAPLLLLGEKGHWDVDGYVEGVFDEWYCVWIFGATVVVSALQWVYLRPVRPPTATGRPVRLVWSMLVGGFAVAALLVGLLSAFYGVQQDLVGSRPKFGDEMCWIALGVLVLNWMMATPLLLSFADRAASHEEYLARVATSLFAGTVVDVLAVLPLDMLARRKEDCWCARGTLWAVVIGLFVGSILCGPAVFLVLLARRRRRWPGGRCVACGADVGGDLRVPRCPGCGAGWAD